MKNTYSSFLILVLLTVLLVGCGGKSTYKKQERAITNETNQTIETTEAIKATENIENVAHTPDITTLKESGVELKHTYITRFEEVNLVTYPAFSFDYPDGWTVTSEEVTPYSEQVVLTNSRGVSITYWHFGKMRDLTGAIRNIRGVDVTRVADASFIPNYVQATDYSDLGKFMVAKLKITSECDMLSGGESIDIENGPVRYALLPESEVGEQYESMIVGLPTFSFWYAGHISLIADSPNGKFTEQEEKEVIAIIASFSDGYASDEDTSVSPESSKSSGSNTAASIDELWSMLKGEWKFEEYIYRGENAKLTDHTLTLRYVDNVPCLSREYHGDNSYTKNVFFYDLASIDEFDYDVYTYKRGSYGGEGSNWSDDVRLVWYNFDLSNISGGELLISYNIAFDNGFIDNHRFRYSKADNK
ncbi:hypothetical protein DWX59_16300 [Enterocloster aldenensis]|nr:hypothetical protein DWX59_16300 [Enterocloster aldenensis]